LAGWFGTAPAKVEAVAKRTQHDLTVAWLGSLSAVTFGLLLLEVGLGSLSGSQTLFADMAHGAGDTVTYVVAYSAEKVKRDLSRHSGASAGAAKLDVFAGATSMLLVVGLSFNAMWQAWAALEHDKDTAIVEENSLVGPALLSFSFASLAANIGLLFLRFQGSDKSTSADTCAEARPTSPATAAQSVSTCKGHQAVPLPTPARLEDEGVSRPSCQHAALPANDQVQPHRQQQVPSEKQSEDLVHSIFHAGCARPGQCPKSSGNTTDEKNLILFGATLHLATDVMRTLLEMCVGVLLQVGMLTDVKKTDAVTALVVGACVLVGTIGFFAGSCAQVRAK